MVKKRFEVEIPDGTHLPTSSDDDGAYRGHLFDNATNKLVGHAHLREVVEGDDDWDEDGSSGSGVLVALAVLGTAAAAVAGTAFVMNRRNQERVRRAEDERRRNEDELRRYRASTHQIASDTGPTPPPTASAGWYDDPYDAEKLRYWNGVAWTAHVSPRARTATTSIAATPVPTSEVRAVAVEQTVSMSSAEWQARFRAMLVARAFSDEQHRLLSHARIEDADPALLELQHTFTQLTPDQFSERITRMLESNPSVLTSAEAEFLRIFDLRRDTAPQVQRAAAPALAQRTQPPRANTAVPAGWYGDGLGGVRWWDGYQWTGHVQHPRY